MSTPDEKAEPAPSAPTSMERPTVVTTGRGVADVDLYVETGEPRHLVAEVIGRGGVGIVHRAHDPRLRRDVAMKMLNPAFAGTGLYVEKFIEEAQIAAQLEHPNIVPIHELGVDEDGAVRFTMKLIRGESLHQWLRATGGPVGSAERLEGGLEIFLKVCDALSFAHSRGVLHRDLKPTNVMVGEFGEVYLMDWGLAKITRTGVSIEQGPLSKLVEGAEGSVGTPGYLAPELARGATAEQDERTDVFGLGALLYEIVTGQPPYPTSFGLPDPAAEVGAYTPLEEALGGVVVAAGLLHIIERALARDREDRYPSAVALKNAVKSFLRGGLHLPRTSFPVGTKIVVEGELGDAAYIVVRGECVAYRVVDGQRSVLRRMGPGDAFGEMAVLSNLPRVATVEAISDVTVIVVTREAIDAELGVDTWVGSLVRALAERFRELDAGLMRQQANDAAGAPDGG